VGLLECSAQLAISRSAHLSFNCHGTFQLLGGQMSTFVREKRGWPELLRKVD
jgi:hypothetical protein